MKIKELVSKEFYSKPHRQKMIFDKKGLQLITCQSRKGLIHL